MAWMEIEQERNLKEFTYRLLVDDRTPWSKDRENQNELSWVDSEVDGKVFAEVAGMIWGSRDLSDQEFLAEVHPQIQQRLSLISIFQDLNDPDIQVTKGHAGVRPLLHTYQVVEQLRTDVLTSEQKGIERLAAYSHDMGKAVSAHFPATEVALLMEKFKSPHSFPNHDLISVMLLEKLAQHADVKKFIERIGPDNWKTFILMVHNHHMLEFKKDPAKGVDEFADLKMQMGELTQNSEQFSSFVLTYVLANADIKSIPAYRQYWEQKPPLMGELLQEGIKESPNAGLSMALAIVAVLLAEGYPAAT
jgi:hypothetical protein